MTAKAGADEPMAEAVDEATRAVPEASADRTDVGSRDGIAPVADLAGGSRWSKDDIAQLARHFEGDGDEETARAAGDPIARRLVANLARRSRPPPGPTPERASSEGGDYVVYSGTAEPVAAGNQPPSAPTVVVTGSDGPTVLLPRLRRSGPGRVLALGRPAAWMALGAALAIMGSRWARTEVAPATTAPKRALCSAASAGVDLAPLRPASRAERAEASASSAVEHPAASLKPISVHHPPATEPMPPAVKRPVETVARKSNLHEDADDGMEATGY